MNKKQWLPVLLISMLSLSQELTYERFIKNLQAYHPAFNQTLLIPQFGDATVLAARGNFDPRINSDLSQKEYFEKIYYRILENDLTIPIVGPLDLQAGYAKTKGDFLNPERTLPLDGLLQFGAKLEVFQGFFANKRSIELKRALNFRNLTKIEQRKALNELIFDASKAYTFWARDYALLKFQKNFVEITKDRFENFKKSYLLGEIAAIDTLEAYIQYQNRLADFNETFIQFFKSTLEVSAFYWDENGPVLLSEEQYPEDLEKIEFVMMDNPNWLDNHPEILATENKIQDLKLERRLKQQGLLPKLSIKYHLLNESFGNQLLNEFNPQNYTFGLQFQLPLFLRRERGDLEITRLKILDAELSLKNKRNVLLNKVLTIDNERKTLEQQVKLFQQIRKNTETLLEAEKVKFSIGESSLFLIIAREIAYLNAVLKQIQTQSKLLETILKLNFEKGGPN